MHRLSALLFCCVFGVAQHQPQAGTPAEKPVELYPGMGIWTHPIGAAGAQAQKFFDQGLTLLYGFNRYEALRSSARSSKSTPARPWRTGAFP